MSKTNILAVLVVLFHLNLAVLVYHSSETSETVQPIISEPLILESSPPIILERKPSITETVPQGDLSYDAVNQWLDRLNQEAPDQTEVGVVGKSTNNKKIKYIRIGPPNDGPKVLITACVHGNEKLSASTSLGVISTLLSKYMVDEEVTDLLKTRQVYYIPIVCPDGYVNDSRFTEGLDPNRNWNGQDMVEIKSISSVQAVKDFHLKHKFQAVMSCHNYGQIYFIPWGYKYVKSDYYDDYVEILDKMGDKSGYDFAQLLRQSAPPYYGYEADWYHKHGALSIVNEIGQTHEARPDNVKQEVESNYEAFKIFIEEAPIVINTR